MKATHLTKDRQIIVQEMLKKRRKKPVRVDVIDKPDLFSYWACLGANMTEKENSTSL